MLPLATICLSISIVVMMFRRRKYGRTADPWRPYMLGAFALSGAFVIYVALTTKFR